MRLLHRVLSGAMKHAYKMDLISRNPMSQVSSSSVVKTEPETPAASAIRGMIALAQGEGNPDHAGIHLIAYPCMRRGEAMSLLRDNVELAQGHIWIEGSLSRNLEIGVQLGPPKTHASRRIVDLDPRTVVVLARHREQQQEMEELYVDCGVVFASPYRDWMNPDNLSKAA